STSRIIVMAAGAALAVALLARPAAARPADSVAAAEQLFAEGRALLARGQLEAACARFEASLALDPAVGTLLNLALCFEERGMLASAWARYREAADRAARERMKQHERVAVQRAAALAPRLPRLLIRAPHA